MDILFDSFSGLVNAGHSLLGPDFTDLFMDAVIISSFMRLMRSVIDFESVVSIPILAKSPEVIEIEEKIIVKVKCASN
jgi:hypothetical protein